MPIDVLNSQVGISTVLPPVAKEHLPSTERFAGIVSSQEFSELAAYKQEISPNGVAQNLAAAFYPSVPSDEALKPEVFNQTLNSLESKLQEHSTQNAAVRRFLREDLQPLQENRSLLQLYLGLMVEG